MDAELLKRVAKLESQVERLIEGYQRHQTVIEALNDVTKVIVKEINELSKVTVDMFKLIGIEKNE